MGDGYMIYMATDEMADWATDRVAEVVRDRVERSSDRWSDGWGLGRRTG